jgi:transcriptional regulator with XRE-family HTH domain
MNDELRKLERSAAHEDFVVRTKQAREAAGFTQEQTARFLGVSLEAYQKYEQRSPLPHCHINDSISLTKVDYAWLFSGKGRRPAVELRMVSTK